MKNNEVIELLRDRPDEVYADDLIYRLYLMQKLEKSEAAADAGDLIPHEEVEKRSAEWQRSSLCDKCSPQAAPRSRDPGRWTVDFGPRGADLKLRADS